MPADDLVLNVRQIAGYPPANGTATGALLMQIGGLGGPYQQISPAALVSMALAAPGSDMAIGGGLSAISFQGGSAQFSNAFANVLGAQTASVTNFSAVTGAIGGVRIATVADVAALGAASVNSFNGRIGAVQLWIDDIICAGGAPIYSPRFTGEPRAQTPPPWSNSSRLATTGFVQGMLAQLTLDYAPLDSPAFIGVPTAPTPPFGSSDATLATTAFVQTAVAGSVAGVSSFNTRTGIVTLTNADITSAGGAVLNSPAFTGAPTAPTPPPSDSSTRIATTAFVLTESGFAPLASPNFTGIPTAPTPTPGTNTTQLATTAYVQAALTGINVGVTTFNGRSGAVSLIANDITAAGGAILASPAFTGTPTAPTPPPGDSSTRIATTAYVQSLAGFAPLASPAFTGVPTAPTAAPGVNTTQLATTAFVLSEIANSTAGVASFNGRSGAVTLQANDLTAAGGALLASPAFTGTPAAPTAALGVSSTQLATTAYVLNAASTTAPLMDGTAAVGNGTTWARSNHVHPTDTSRYAASNPSGFQTAAQVTTSLAAYVPLAGGVIINNPLTIRAGSSRNALSLTIGAGNVTMMSLFDTAGGNDRSDYYFDHTGQNLVITHNPAATNILLSASGGFGYSGGSGVASKVGGGSWTATSDARIKTVQGDYKSGLEEIAKLQPVLYRYKGNDAPQKGAESPHAKVASDQTAFIGLIAQAVETVMPEMVKRTSGVIDGAEVDDLRTLDTTPLIFALVNAVRALVVRLETLEARIAT